MNAAVQKLHPDDEQAHWDSDTETQIQSFGELVIDIDKKRKALNDKKAAAKSDLVSRGFHPDAIKAALSYHGTPEADRHNWDLSYIYTRRALGCPIQSDMFDLAGQDELDVDMPTKKED